MFPSWSRLAIASLVTVGLAFGLPAVGGCEQPEACATYLAISVRLQVVDAETGEPIASPTISFQVDGGELRMPTEANSSPLGHVLAVEEAGLFTVSVEADGYEPGSAEYEVTRDGCHINSVIETMELVAVADPG